MRHGFCLEAMDPLQRERALALLQASLSAQGFQTARDIMRLNETIAEIIDRWEEYGEWVYWLSLFGTLSTDAPWGWPIDGYHLIINDNPELHYEGIRFNRLSPHQQELLLALIDTYVGCMAPCHAAVKMEEVRQHLGDTYFAWMGEVEEESVFYYRVHSPVILIEFDY